MLTLSRSIILIVLLFSPFCVPLSFAEDEQGKADAAVANILFDYDGASEFASYRVSDSGEVDITFARNMPDKLYSEILNKLANNPDIKHVLAGKGGPTCSLF